MNAAGSEFERLSLRDKKLTVKLIRAYESQNVLWNKENPDFVFPMARNVAWTTIANEVQMHKTDVKQKIKYLTGWFRRQQRQNKVTQRWWTPFMSFLEPVPHCKQENNIEATAIEDCHDNRVDSEQQTVEQMNDAIMQINDESITITLHASREIHFFPLMKASTIPNHFTYGSHIIINY
ncbi:uncharacterized protein LOC111075173 isoform X1 [Drosophila obscura]|uniref:uncharacterized protein LOC111075173 isoform X1 n=1 Tax=Drosophila obscura TaxID=7282 RepID=UPI001BB1D454|nr:uncharacterized protein LOC111075173 isoform X1 [Drosophila obscura]